VKRDDDADLRFSHRVSFDSTYEGLKRSQGTRF